MQSLRGLTMNSSALLEKIEQNGGTPETNVQVVNKPVPTVIDLTHRIKDKERAALVLLSLRAMIYNNYPEI